MPSPSRRSPRRRRSSAALYGGTPLPLPLVSTLSASSITAEGATLIGSLNPQGLTGSWWFEYGTTPQLGTVLAAGTIAAISYPLTVETVLIGLSNGTAYYFALVGQTAGGTVTGNPVQFTAQNPQPVAPSPSMPVGTPSVTIPHFDFPFSLDPQRGAGVWQQDSYEEITSCVTAVCACPVGACPELPSFGITDPTFATAPPDTTALATQVQLWEPRASQDAVAVAMDDSEADWAITLTGTVTGTGQ